MAYLTELREIGRLRTAYIRERDELLMKRTQSISDKLRLIIIRNVIDALDTEAGNIKNNRYNISKSLQVNSQWKSFVKNDFAKLIKDHISGLGKLGTFNRKYFEVENTGRINLSEIQAKAEADLNFRLGVTERGSIIEGGYLDRLIQDPTIRNQIINTIQRGITGEVGRTELIESVSNQISGTEQVDGNLTKYVRQYVHDTYSTYDNQMADTFAVKLGLDYAVYAGTEIKTTRPFCEVRINKVFTREEISKFGTSADKYGGYSDKKQGKFQGKTDPYDPFRDLGGYNCRHSWNWISLNLAKRLRPDLAQ